MGFCIYCNQKVYSETSCPKCYRTISTTTAANEKKIFPSIFTNQKKTDKWQDTYGKKAIFNTDSSTKRPMPKFTTTLKTCEHCHEKKETSWSMNSKFYCKPCLTTKITCPICEKHFAETDHNQVYYNQKVWHANCFKCHQCTSNLNPTFTVMKDDKLTCRACQVKQASTPFTSSVSTPLLEKYKFQRTLSTEIKSPIDMKPSISQSTDFKHPISMKPIDIKQPTDVKPVNKEPRRKKVLKRPCKECGLHVSKKDYRGLKIQTGEIHCFHKNCLICAKCNENFNTLDFCTDGKNFFHTECPNMDSPVSSRQSSPLSEEEDCPPTPPPHSTYFNVADNDTFTNDLQEKKSLTEMQCHGCKKSVTNTYLELANNIYHKECLICAGCNNTVTTDTKLIRHQDKLYCEQCCKNESKKPKLTIQIETTEQPPKRNPTITTPSDIFKSRKKVLPQLGGARTCARCNQSMPFSDIQPGPNASRWHKKCLRCAGCDKQMDSDAHMTINEKTGRYLVHCRGCMDDTPKPRFVR